MGGNWNMNRLQLRIIGPVPMEAVLDALLSAESNVIDTLSAVMHTTDTTNISGAVTDTTKALDATPPQEPGPSGTHGSRPLSFHSVHSSNIWVSKDGSLAWRMWPDTNPGVAFSSRPLGIKETVCLRVVEATRNWRYGVIRVGISTKDPAALPNPVPEYSTSYWATALEHSLKKNDIFSFYVKPNGRHGRVCLTINGKDKSLASPKLDTRLPFWALVEPGGSTALQFVDTSRVTTRISTLSPVELRSSIPELRMVNLITLTRVLFGGDPLPLRYPHPVEDLSLHSTKGRNVQFSSGIAVRIEPQFAQGYVFSAEPICPGQTIVIQVLLSKPVETTEGLAFGLTNCDPATLRPCDLPDIAEELPDRPEYWVVRRYANDLCKGTELAMTLTAGGAVLESRENFDPITVMHVDATLTLWAFVDIYGATRKVRILTRQTRSDAVLELKPEESSASDPECSICCDNVVDSALYKCGHSCTCYACAVQLWQTAGGKCPICRSDIKDVIRIYKAV